MDNNRKEPTSKCNEVPSYKDIGVYWSKDIKWKWISNDSLTLGGEGHWNHFGWWKHENILQGSCKKLHCRRRIITRWKSLYNQATWTIQTRKAYCRIKSNWPFIWKYICPNFTHCEEVIGATPHAPALTNAPYKTCWYSWKDDRFHECRDGYPRSCKRWPYELVKMTYQK